MVRATDLNTRLVLAGLLREADSPCRRLFLDYHGLKILGGWMAELGWAADKVGENPGTPTSRFSVYQPIFR